MDGFTLSLNARVLPIKAGKPIAILHEDVARELGIMPLDRVEIKNPKTKKSLIAIIDVTHSLVSREEIGLFEDISHELKVKESCILKVRAVERPKSVEYIKKKILGKALTAAEIRTIVKDLDQNRLSDVEAGAFMSAVYIRGYNMAETVAMTKALIENGKRIRFDVEPIVDKHSIGGINGRATMVIVPIVASAGLYIPKTSSRSITSAAGTADAMEVLANVCLQPEEIKEITERIGGVIAWGGALNLAPVDEKIIKIEYPLSLNPQGQIIASVLAKKASVGSQYVVVDIPLGKGLKIENKDEAEILAGKFLAVGKKLGIHIEAVITDGTQPSGPAFGPALEARHVMRILEGKCFDTLAQKSCELSGVLFELVGKAKPGKGFGLAKKILESGRALRKMKQIIKAQQGNIFSSKDIELAHYKASVCAKREGEIARIDVRRLTNIARAAGAPYDKKAGVLLHVDVGDNIKKGALLYEIFAENKRKLASAVKETKRNDGVELSRIIIKKII
jgi:AMP phosphorylase